MSEPNPRAAFFLVRLVIRYADDHSLALGWWIGGWWGLAGGAVVAAVVVAGGLVGGTLLYAMTQDGA